MKADWTLFPEHLALSDAALDKMAESAVGKPVRDVNGKRIGAVLKAERTEVGIEMEIDLPDDFIGAFTLPTNDLIADV